MNIIQTESEGQARGLVESLDEVVDAIVVAGGDGTVSEVITKFAHLITSICLFCAGELHVPFSVLKILFIELDFSTLHL